MDKTQLLSLVQEKIEEGVITQEDLKNLSYNDNEQKSSSSTKHITNIFYIIGALIAVVGVIILTAQYWEEIGFFGRVLVTLGISIVTYVSALFMKNSSQRILAQVFFAISSALAPIGIIVFMREMNIDFDAFSQALSAFALSAVFLSALWYSRRNILVLISTAYITWGYYAILIHLFSFGGSYLKWATMILGTSYICIAYYYQNNKTLVSQEERIEKKSVENILYGVGTISILAAAISFGGIFDFILIGLIFATFYASVYVKSKLMLAIGALFLIIHIIKITSEYFVDSVGWPLALIVIGFMIIGIGYGTVYISRKFISNKV